MGSQSVYLDAGSALGVARGDSAEVWRDQQVIARLEVVYVAENSSSARVITRAQELQIGDRVKLVISAEVTQYPTASDTLTAPKSEVKTAISGAPAAASGKRQTTRVRGRLAAQISLQDNRETTDHDVIKPALLLRTTIENLFLNYLNFSLNLKARQIFQREGESTSLQSDWDNRLYEIALQYDNPGSALNYQMGRIASNRISGIGIIDGALIEYKLDNGWSGGVFGGVRPDLATPELNTAETTAGLYAAFERGSWRTAQVRGTLALAGRYRFGEIDQEFIYEQASYGLAQHFSLTQSAELAINRGWREQAEGSTWGLTNVLINASYSPAKVISLDLGYDNRRQARTYETKDTPDSLFDDALRQGFRAGIRSQWSPSLRVWLRGGLRTRESGGTDTRSLTAGFNLDNILKSGVSASLQFDRFENSLNAGDQISLSLARYIFSRLYLQGEAGRSQYDFTTASDPIAYHWFHGAANSTLSRHFYVTSYGEIYRGDSLNTNRFGAELGYRF